MQDEVVDQRGADADLKEYRKRFHDRLFQEYIYG